MPVVDQVLQATARLQRFLTLAIKLIGLIDVNFGIYRFRLQQPLQGLLQ